MSIEKVEQLEELIALAVERLDNLYAEKLRLEKRMRELENEKEIALKENEKFKSSQEKIKQLKVSHRKLEKDRSAVRLKVKDALQRIEKMDFV